MRVVASKALLELTNLQQAVLPNSPAKLPNKRDMLRDIAGKPPELRVLFNKSLHICDTLDIHVRFSLMLICIHIILDVPTEVAEIEIHVLLEEWVLIL